MAHYSFLDENNIVIEVIVVTLKDPSVVVEEVKPPPGFEIV